MNFITDIGMPPLIEEFKSYGGIVIILKEREKLKDEISYTFDNNVLKLSVKSLKKVEDFDKIFDVFSSLSIDNIDYFFPFNEKKFKLYFDFCKKHKIKTNIKESYVKNSKKDIARKLVTSHFKDIMFSKLVDIEIEKFKYPCILKPIVGNGSEDVLKVLNKDEMKNLIKEKDLNKYFVEEFIEGKEISVEAIHYKGNHLIYGVTGKIKYNNSFVEAGHISDYYKLSEKDINKILKIYDILNYDDTVSHTEFILTNDDIVMVESHPRLGGDLIPSLYEEKFSENLYKIIVKCLCKKLEKIEELKELSVYKFSYFPIPNSLPSKINMNEEIINELKQNFDIDLVIQNFKNDTDIKRVPIHSFDRPLTLRGSSNLADIDYKLNLIDEFCNKKIYKREY